MEISTPWVARKLSTPEDFLLKFANEELDASIERSRISGKDLYNKYQEYIQAKEKTDAETITAFGLQVKQVKGVSSKRMTHGVTYTLDFADIKTDLEG